MKNLSVVGWGYKMEETVVGFYNIEDRVKFWGSRGAFWGGFWGLLFGGVFLTLHGVGHAVVVGYLAAMVVAAVENAVVVGGLSAIGAARYSIGIPKDSVIQYEASIKADEFLVMAHGSKAEMLRAKELLATPNHLRNDLHPGLTTQATRELNLV